MAGIGDKGEGPTAAGSGVEDPVVLVSPAGRRPLFPDSHLVSGIFTVQKDHALEDAYEMMRIRIHSLGVIMLREPKNWVQAAHQLIVLSQETQTVALRLLEAVHCETSTAPDDDDAEQAQ